MKPLDKIILTVIDQREWNDDDEVYFLCLPENEEMGECSHMPRATETWGRSCNLAEFKITSQPTHACI